MVSGREQTHTTGRSTGCSATPNGRRRPRSPTRSSPWRAQQFLRVEPQLPAELAPADTGTALRSRYADVVSVFQARLSEFFGRRRPTRGDEPLSTAAR
jgi:hypothetical protein